MRIAAAAGAGALIRSKITTWRRRRRPRFTAFVVLRWAQFTSAIFISPRLALLFDCFKISRMQYDGKMTDPNWKGFVQKKVRNLAVKIRR